MKNAFRNIIELLKAIIVPLVLIIVVSFLLLRMVNISDKDVFNVILGVALGVVLGFIANTLKDAIDEFRGEAKLRKIALKLLEQDAKKAHQTMWLYKTLIASNDVPEDIKKQIPPLLELKYWSNLNQNVNFLLLGSENPFSKIFSDFWELEKLNKFITNASNGDKNSYAFAVTLYKHTIDDNGYRDPLLNFFSSEEIDEIENSWLSKK